MSKKKKDKEEKPGSGFRDRAEEVLKEKHPEPEMPQDDALSMIHELQVHQVELEIMNEELRRSKALSESALEKLMLVIETANIGLWEVDLKNDYLTLDNSSEKIFGLNGSDRNYPEKLEDLVCDEDMNHITSGLEACLIDDMPFETVFRARKNECGTKFIRLKARVKKNGRGKAVSLTGVFFDITGLKEGSEMLINKLNEDLLRSNKELQTFVYVASHDLQEPLRMVSSFTQLLAKDYSDKLDERAHEYIQFAVEGAKRMYELLNDLLDYSRINTRGQNFRWIDMNEALSAAKNNLSILIREKKVAIKSDKLPNAFADGSQMVRLFQNLISNSIKFAENKPYIYITSRKERRKDIFIIRDNGIGIESQYFDKIFQIFQRLGPRTKYEGTGIGLAICKNIVDRHHGKIWVESVPGKGSTFFFSIPHPEQK